MPIGDPVLAFVTLESTNKTAAELLKLSKVQHGAVILAHEQTSGRGQRGRVWNSVAGADLTVSIVLKPTHLRAEDQFALAKLAALAVAEVVHALVAAEVRVKWPNDVLVERRKVAGILIKNEVVGELVQSCIVGIGINGNSQDFPEELMATSLRLETGREIDLTDLRMRLCQALDRRWAAWEAGDTGLDHAYAELLWSRGRWSPVVLDGNTILARPMDVDKHGRLIVELEGGQVGAFDLDRLRFGTR